MRTTAGKWITALIVLLVGAGVTVGVGFLLNYLQVYQTPLTAQAGGASTSQQANLTLYTFPQGPDSVPQWEAEHNYHTMENLNTPTLDQHQEWVTYGPSTNLVVPAHSTVNVTIYQYDSGKSLLNDFYSNVRGTVGNTMTVDGKTYSSWSSDDIAHTFTIHGYASNDQPWLFVNVPLPRLPDDVVSAGTDNGLAPHPHVIKFSFQVGGPGKYVWQCEYPCGDGYNGFGGPMSTNGFMNGTLTVQ